MFSYQLRHLKSKKIIKLFVLHKQHYLAKLIYTQNHTMIWYVRKFRINTINAKQFINEAFRFRSMMFFF